MHFAVCIEREPVTYAQIHKPLLLQIQCFSDSIHSVDPGKDALI